MKPDVSYFDQLPDSAMVTIKTLCFVSDMAESTAWRRCKLEADFPKPIRLGAKCTRFNVGDVRRFLAGAA